MPTTTVSNRSPRAQEEPPPMPDQLQHQFQHEHAEQNLIDQVQRMPGARHDSGEGFQSQGERVDQDQHDDQPLNAG